jgi:hypothetical protein
MLKTAALEECLGSRTLKSWIWAPMEELVGILLSVLSCAGRDVEVGRSPV